MRIHKIVPVSKVNGPGSRFVLWMQGCARNCPYCFNMETHSKDKGHNATTDDIISRVPIDEVNGITVSGGEPRRISDTQQRQGAESIGGSSQQGFQMTLAGYNDQSGENENNVSSNSAENNDNAFNDSNTTNSSNISNIEEAHNKKLYYIIVYGPLRYEKSAKAMYFSEIRKVYEGVNKLKEKHLADYGGQSKYLNFDKAQQEYELLPDNNSVIINDIENIIKIGGSVYFSKAVFDNVRGIMPRYFFFMSNVSYE